MFKSFPQQIWASTERAIDKIKNGTAEEKKAGYRVLFLNTVIMPSLYGGAVTLFESLTGRAPENEDEETRYLDIIIAGVLDPVEGWIGVGPFIESFVNGLSGRDAGFSLNKFTPAAGLAKDTEELAELMRQAVASWAFGDGEEFDKALDDFSDSFPAIRSIKDVVLDQE
jgi:hypothetical protein